LPCRNKYPRRAEERSGTEQPFRSLETVQRVEVVSLQREEKSLTAWNLDV
jgi:hypothetical protein